MEASDLIYSPIFATNHQLTNRSNLTPNSLQSDSSSSLLFPRTSTSGLTAAAAAATATATAAAVAAASNGSPMTARNSSSVMLNANNSANNTNNSPTTSSVCGVNNANTALMNAFGLANGLQLPSGLWDNPLFSAALSQYIDANSPLIRCSMQNACNNLEQMRNATSQANVSVASSNGSLNSNNNSLSNGNVALNLQQSIALCKDDLVESSSKKTSVKRSDQRPPIPLKKMRAAEAQAAANKELAYLEQGKSFPCPECHKSFSTEVDLKAHLLRHVMQHPYSCPTCGKGFKYEHTLDFHMKSQHSQEAANSPKLNLKNSAKKNNALANSSRRIDQEDRPAVNKLLKAAKQQSQVQQAQASQLKNAVFDVNETEDLNNNQVLALSLKNTHSNKTEATNLTNSMNESVMNGTEALQGASNLFGSGMQVKAEKVLIVQLEGFNPVNEQTYTLYKCNLCGYSQAKLSLVAEHVQTQHSPPVSVSTFTCDKCGASFKWQNELLVHEQLHKALNQASAASNQQPSLSNSNTNAFKNMLIPPFLQSNLLLMNQYFNATAAANACSSSASSNSFSATTSSDSAKAIPENGLNLKKINLLESSQTVPESIRQSPIDMTTDLLSGIDSQVKREVAQSGVNSPGGSSVAVLKELTGNGVQSSTDNDYSINLSKSARKDSESSSQESLALRKPSKLMLKELRSEEIDELSKNIAVVKEHSKSDLGEIEETAPGQFKCRFCEKTFDRIFSVHRHERVHTGFKPCVCKVCGRGFSEKRNLRHHIIRFHSDGSGRELLRRVRKDKSGSLENGEARRQLKLMELSLLGLSGTSGDLNSNQGSEDELGETDDVNELNGTSNQSAETEADAEQEQIINHSDYSSQHLSASSSKSIASSSSRRRKSMPCKKLLVKLRRKVETNQTSLEEGDDEEEDYELDEDEDEEDEEQDRLHRNQLEDDEQTQDMNDSDQEDRLYKTNPRCKQDDLSENSN